MKNTEVNKMAMTALNDIVTLMQIEEGYGHEHEELVVKSNIVWADVREPSTSLKINASSAGIKADIVMYCWRNEFCKFPYTHVDINKKRYKIAATGSAANDLTVKITLTRC